MNMGKLRYFYCPWPLHSTCTICTLNKVWCSILPSLCLPHARAFPSKLTSKPMIAFKRNGWWEKDEVKVSLFRNFTKDFLVLKLNNVAFKKLNKSKPNKGTWVLCVEKYKDKQNTGIGGTWWNWDKIHAYQKCFMLYDTNLQCSPQDYSRISKTLAIYYFHTLLPNN